MGKESLPEAPKSMSEMLVKREPSEEASSEVSEAINELQQEVIPSSMSEMLAKKNIPESSIEAQGEDKSEIAQEEGKEIQEENSEVTPEKNDADLEQQETELKAEIGQNLEGIEETTDQIEQLMDDPNLSPTLQERMLQKIDDIGREMKASLRLDGVKHIFTPMSGVVISAQVMGMVEAGSLLYLAGPVVAGALALYAGIKTVELIKRMKRENKEVSQVKSDMESGTVEGAKDGFIFINKQMKKEGGADLLDEAYEREDEQKRLEEEKRAKRSAELIEEMQMFSRHEKVRADKKPFTYEEEGEQQEDPSSITSEEISKLLDEFNFGDKEWDKAKKKNPQLTRKQFYGRISQALQGRK